MIIKLKYDIPGKALVPATPINKEDNLTEFMITTYTAMKIRELSKSSYR